MADNIIPIQHTEPRDDVREGDDFLIREGFDLLAAYRDISDIEIRKTVLNMILSISAGQKRALANRP